MVCILDEDKRYVWSGDSCVLCDGALETTMYMVLAGFVCIVIGLMAFVAYARKTQEGQSQSLASRLETFAEKVQTKYKILISFVQILTKVVTEYPIRLPSLFTSFWAHFALLQFDLGVLPISCMVDSNFHDRLLFTTLTPIAFVLFICLFWAGRRQCLARKGGENFIRESNSLTARSISVCFIFLFTVFPIVSTTIFQVD